jgi:hypothetical protein
VNVPRTFTAINFVYVLRPGFEPGIAVPKTAVISVSPPELTME